MHNGLSLKTYHLYHHQPDPLLTDAVNEQAWLVNNGVAYSVVATIRTRTPEEAYRLIQEKTSGQSLRGRFIELRAGNVLRETLPGDVLAGENAAWMIQPGNVIESIPYEISSAWKSYTHKGTVKNVSWSPDGKYVVASNYADEVVIHSLSEGDERDSVTSYCRHDNWIAYALAWSPDGTHIASGGYYNCQGEVHVWKPAPFGGHGKAATGSIMICCTEEQGSYGKSRIMCTTWEPDSRYLLAGREDGSCVQWDTMTGACLLIVKRHQKTVTDLAYSPDGTSAASASDDGTIRVWKALEDPDQDIICQHTDEVSSFAWSPDSTLIVSSCKTEDQTLYFWNALTGEPGERIPLSVYSTKPLSIKTVDWSPDGRFIVAGCDDGTLQVIDVLLRRHVLTYRIGDHHEVHCAAWSPDGKWIASGGSEKWGGYSGKVQIWQVRRDMEHSSDHETESCGTER